MTVYVYTKVHVIRLVYTVKISIKSVNAVCASLVAPDPLSFW